MSAEPDDFHIWNDELSDRETFFIGKIVAQWGALEYEIFVQTLLSFDTPDGEEVALPKAMNNLQFTGVLSLWKERVADKADEKRGEVLQKQYEKILKLKDYRDALAHGMWECSGGELAKINAIRIRKKEIVSVQFTADALENFFSRIASINFKVRFPDGIEEFAQKQSEAGGYISRRWLSIMTGHPLAGEWLPSADEQDKKKGHDHDAGN